MFSRQTAERFDSKKSRQSTPGHIGPGSYDLPSTLEGKAGATWDSAVDRWAETSVEALGNCESPAPAQTPRSPGEKSLVEATGVPSAPTPARNAGASSEKAEKARQRPASPVQRLQKDSHSFRSTSPRAVAPSTPSAATATSKSAVTPPATGALRESSSRVNLGPPAALTGPSSKANLGTTTTTTPAAAPGETSRSAEISADARQRHKDLRLVSQLDAVRDELKQRSRENKELQLSLAAKDRKLEELQRKIEELAADKREAHRRTVEAESERDMKRRQLHEKEQDNIALQRKLDRVREANEERNKQRDRKDEEQRVAQSELQRLKISVDSLQERLANSEQGRKSAEQGLRQQQKRTEDLESGLKAHLAVVEESLNRESTRRRELEELQVKDGVERELGTAELAQARKRAEELESRVTQLQNEMKEKLATDFQKSEEQNRLEDELSSIKAKAQASEEALKRSEAQRAEFQKRSAQAEVALEASSKELAAKTNAIAELEAEQQRFGQEQYQKIQDKVEIGEKQIKDLTQELADERARCEGLERQAALYKEQEEAALKEKEAERQARLSDPTYRELEARALRAETEAEELQDNLLRWKEWGDEQQLRELTAEGERLMRLKQVREEVLREVEDAREALVEENRALQRRIVELENGPTGSSTTLARLEEQDKRLTEQEAEIARKRLQEADLEAEIVLLKQHVEVSEVSQKKQSSRFEEQQQQLEEKCRQLEARAARAEADAAVAADEFAEEREKLEIQCKSIRSENEAALASQSSQASSCLEAVKRNQEELQEELKASRMSSLSARWQILVQASLRQQLIADQEAVFTETRRAASRWRTVGRGQAGDSERCLRQESELERLDEENELLKEQNKQVLESLQAQQQDLQSALAETKRLQEREAAFEADMSRMSERSAELGGHANPKQKIKHLMAVKEENQSMREELKRSKQLISQLEAKVRTSQFFEAANAPTQSSSSERCRTPSRRQNGPAMPTTPGKNRAALSSDPLIAASDDRIENETLRKEKAEQVRIAKAHRRASERAANEYHHLYSLVEKALAVGSLGGAAIPGLSLGGPGNASSGTSGGSDPKDLYRRLRELSVNLASTSPNTSSHEDVPTPRQDAKARFEPYGDSKEPIEDTSVSQKALNSSELFLDSMV